MPHSPKKSHQRISRRNAIATILPATVLTLQSGCDSQQSPDSETVSASGSRGGSPLQDETDSQQEKIVQWGRVPELSEELVVFESVFWQPADTHSLRRLIVEEKLADGKTVLEVGTGSGLVSLCCLAAGATSVVATDINPAAVRNAEYNARRMNLADRFQCRLVPRRDPGAWSVISDDERFDVIVSNPPWELGKPTRMQDFALYDPGFGLLKSLISGARGKLNPGGRLLLAYGCVTAVREILKLSSAAGLEASILDDRSLDELPEVFLPGMLIDVHP